MRLLPYRIVTKLIVILLAFVPYLLSIAHAQSTTEISSEKQMFLQFIKQPSKIVSQKANIIEKKEPEAPVVIVEVKPIKAQPSANVPKSCLPYYDMVSAASEKYNVRESLLITQLYKESGCNPNAVSKTGDYGICQIHLSAHPDVTQEQALNPEFCINFQAEKMMYLQSSFGNEYEALRAYNCGLYGARNPSCGSAYANSILADSY
ncbi:MAG: transglycosylase SLT domain-containing protein [bacterium]